MKTAILCLAASVALSGCGTEQRAYEMSVAEATSKLVNTDFERSIVPGSSQLKPKVMRNEEGTLEWQVLDDSENGNGWWCPLEIEQVDDQGKKVRVVNKCEGVMAMNNKHLDELVDATLTGRPPQFE